MNFDPNDERPYMFFVKLPHMEHKFAIGCKTLRSASVGYIIDFAKDVAERTKYEYTEEPIVYCLEIGKIIVDDTALALCISRGYSFEVFNGISSLTHKIPKRESKVIQGKIDYDTYFS